MDGEPTVRPGTISCVPAVLSCFFLLSACAKVEPARVKITGKTVYEEMAIEEVAVRAFRWEDGRWTERAAGKSGYHGSFVLEVPPGRYRLEANGVIPRGPENVELGGHVELPETAPGDLRIDRVVIELAPVREVRAGEQIPRGTPDPFVTARTRFPAGPEVLSMPL